MSIILTVVRLFLPVVFLFVFGQAYATSCSELFITGLKRAAANTRISSLQTSWDQSKFRNPNEHQDNSFVYLVHAVSDPETKLVQKFALMQMLVKTGRTIPDDAFDDALNAPEKIFLKSIISASLISNEKSATFMPAGYILSVPKENIYAASSGDMFHGHYIKPFSRQEALRELEAASLKFGLPTPEKTLSRTEPRMHNEILLAGVSPSGSQVSVSGIFIKVDQEGNPLCTKYLWDKLHQNANRLGLPIVLILEEVRKYEDQPVKIEEPLLSWTEDSRLISFHKNGVRHVILVSRPKDGSGKWTGSYKAIKAKKYINDPDGKASFRAALNRKRLDDNQIEEILRDLGDF